jgi:hypothetical protein
MGKKGIKSRRGQGEAWDEPKSERLNLQLTATGKRLFKEIADSLGVSFAEVIERFARGLLKLDEKSSVSDRVLSIDEVRRSFARFSGIQLIRLGREILAQAESTMRQRENLPQEDETEDAGLLAIAFIQKLITAKADSDDALELSGVLDLEDSEAESLTEIVKLVQKHKRGGKKPNGV